MPKNIIILLFLLSFIFSVSSCFAQSGLIMGPTFGSFIPNLKVNSGNPVVSGFNTVGKKIVGMSLSLIFNDKWRLSSGLESGTLAFEKNGSQVIPHSAYRALLLDGNNNLGTLYSDFYVLIKINAISIPLLAEYSLYKSENNQLLLGSGFYFNIYGKSLVETNGKNYVYKDQGYTQKLFPYQIPLVSTQSLDGRINDMDFGSVNKVSFLRKIPYGFLQVSCKNNFSFFYFQRNSEDGENKLASVSVSLAYLFDIP